MEFGVFVFYLFLSLRSLDFSSLDFSLASSNEITFLADISSFSYQLGEVEEFSLPPDFESPIFGILENRSTAHGSRTTVNGSRALTIETLNVRGNKILRVSYFPFLIKDNKVFFRPAKFQFEEPKIKLERLPSLDTLKNYFQSAIFIFKIYIDSSGLYKITGKELKEKGLPLENINPDNFQLFSIGNYLPNRFYCETLSEVPIIVKNKEKGKFKEDDYLLFYARGASFFYNGFSEYCQNLYNLESVYWLFYGNKKGMRMKEVSSLPDNISLSEDVVKEKKHFEEDKDCPARGGLLWIWDKIEKSMAEDYKEIGYSFSIPGIWKLLSLKARIFCDDYSDFFFKIFLNNKLFDSLKVFSAQSPNGFLFLKDTFLDVNSPLSLRLSFYKENKALNFYTDYFEFTYLRKLSFDFAPFFALLDSEKRYYLKVSKPKEPIILDITDEFSPKILKDYLVKNDTLYFAYNVFLPSILYLTDLKKVRKVKKIENKSEYRNSNIHLLNGDFYIIVPDELYYIAKKFHKGEPLIVRLSEICDHYLFGIFEPYALKKFFSLKRPLYGLLLGDATYDYRGIITKRPQIFTYEIGYGFDYEVYNTSIYALDSYFADFEGDGRSPDFVLARLPLRNEKEVSSYLKKLSEYERNLAPYKKRFLLLADDEYKGSPDIPDEFRDTHIRNCENIANLIPKDYLVYKLYLTEFNFLGENDKTNASDKFLDFLKKGVGFCFYFGHGAGFQLAHEKLLTLADVLKIKARPNYPIGYFGSCGVGRFDDTKFESLCEELIRADEGFIGTIGAIKGTSPYSNEELLRRFLSSLIYQNEDTLGKIFFSAWPINPFYHLFAYPLIKINLPKRREVSTTIESLPFLCGKKSEIKINLEKEAKEIALSLNLGKKKRRYKSKFIDITYLLEGEEVFFIKENLKDSFYSFTFAFPKGLSLDTIFLSSPENYYWEVPKTLNLSIFYLKKDSSFTFNIDTLSRDTIPYLSFDTTPPIVNLFAFNKELKDTFEVLRDFLLQIRAFDESGIFLVENKPYSPKIILNNEEIPLSSCFFYSFPYYYGKVPISLKEENSLLKVIIYDNLLNKSERKVFLKTKLLKEITISSLKVVSLKNTIYFTFNLSEPAIGSVKIYSLNGKKLIERNNLLLNYGFNTITINNSFARGVYLYKLILLPLERKEKKEVYGKLIIDY